MNEHGYYSSEEMMDARISGWDDCKKLVLELLKENKIHYTNSSLYEEIENEDFGIIDCPIKNIKGE